MLRRARVPRIAHLCGYLASASLFGVALAEAASPYVPKNVIVMISDGCGYNQIAAADYYQYGRLGSQVYESFPVRVAMSTYANNNTYDPTQFWSWFDYAKQKPTDSAAAATAMSCGVKSYNAAIGVGSDTVRVRHLSEVAEDLGKSTGVITTVEWSHATPAGFVAHNPSRNDYAGIARAMIDTSRVDVIMGAGHPHFDDNGRSRTVPEFKYVGGESTWNALLAGTAGGDADGDGTPDPWTVVQSRAQFQALMSGPTPRRVVGVAQVATTMQQNRGVPADSAYDGTKANPNVIPFNAGVPTLAEMSRAALNVLDENPHGLFLMVEGGAIDWAGHANQSGRVIEEEVDFNRAVEAVVAWVDANSSWNETLLIVTGDHETGYLTGLQSGPDSIAAGTGEAPRWNPIAGRGIGTLPLMEWHSLDHSNSLVPLFAKGVGSELLGGHADQLDPVRGPYLDNTEIATTIFHLYDGSYLPTAVEEVPVGRTLPAEAVLEQNYPNPFNASTLIRFSLPHAGPVRLSVHNATGQEVAVLVSGYQQAGTAEVTWDAGNVASGLYFSRLETGAGLQLRQMVLLK